jgi:hypothetical protein
MTYRALVAVVGVLAVGGVAGCSSSKDVSVGGKTYHVSSGDSLTSSTGQAWLMNQLHAGSSEAQCIAQKLGAEGVNTVNDTTQSSNGAKNTAAAVACAGQ